MTHTTDATHCPHHGLTPNVDGECNACEIDAPPSKPELLTGIALEWARMTTLRMRGLGR